MVKKREQMEQVAKKQGQMVQKCDNQLENEEISLCSGERGQEQTNHKEQHRRQPNDQQCSKELYKKERHRGEHQVEQKARQTSAGYRRPRGDHRSEGYCGPPGPSFVSYKGGEEGERGKGTGRVRGEDKRLRSCSGVHGRSGQVLANY